MAPRRQRRPAFKLGGVSVEAGSRATVELPAPALYTHTEIAMPVHVVHGSRDGPRMFVSATIHGDELNGVEIVRRLLRLSAMKRLRGTLLAVPIVNVHGCIQRTRELPDGRDLNRSFPGSATGSMAARMAHLFMSEIVAGSDYGIDLHTATSHRTNLPQIRTELDDPGTEKLARAFGAPVILHSNLRDGSLRQVAQEEGTVTLLYEAGEALRFDEVAIRAGVRGIVAVMREVGMLPRQRRRKRWTFEPVISRQSSWVRAPASGILRVRAALGATVKRGETLAMVADPFGESETTVESHVSGVVIGRVNLPLVHAGEALFHVAQFPENHPMDETMEAFHESHDPNGPDQEGEEPVV